MLGFSCGWLRLNYCRWIKRTVATMELRNANLISILAKKLEKRGIENKGLTDMQAGEIAFYAELHDAEWIDADNSVWVDLVISLPPWA